MGIGAPAVSVPVLMICKLPQTVSVHGAGGTGVPATNKLEPLSRPTVAPLTGMGLAGLKTGAPLKFTRETPAGALPAHSGPQNRMNAVVSLASLGSKTAV